MECMEKLTKKVLDRSEIRGFCGSKEQKPELHAYFCNTFDSKPHTVSHCPYSPPQLPHVALLSMLHIHHLGLNVKDNGSDQVEHHHPITSH